MTEDSILFDRKGPVAIITLNRPARRNAIDATTGDQLRQAVERFAADPDLRVAILAATGPVFCAGMDLKAFVEGEAEEILFGEGRLGGFVSRVVPKPMIAAVQGPALAGGFELVLACDLVVASRDARFGLPESRIGLVAGAGGAFRLGQMLPRALATEMLLTGAPISAEQAQAHGLVNRLTDADPLPEAMELAQQIAANAPLSLAASLELSRAASRRHDEGCWALNDRLLRRLVDSRDAVEGARAFAERRAPVWQGD